MARLPAGRPALVLLGLALGACTSTALEAPAEHDQRAGAATFRFVELMPDSASLSLWLPESPEAPGEGNLRRECEAAFRRIALARHPEAWWQQAVARIEPSIRILRGAPWERLVCRAQAFVSVRPG